MQKEKSLLARTYALLALMVVFSTGGNVLLSDGMKRLGAPLSWTPRAVFHFFVMASTDGIVWLGTATLVLFLVSHMLVLSWADYSYVSPASAIGYSLVAVLGYGVLGEQVRGLRWTGVALICAGVILVGRTPVSTRTKDRT
jgi:drug/metabolite transporter (DMT)-like permease